MREQTWVIIGGGQAAAVAAASLRSAGFQGRLVLIGDEQHLPYERPPLSKEVLVKPEKASLSIHPESFYAENAIECRLGVAAVGLDAEQQVVTLADGSVISFDRLLLATGARARAYPLLDHLGSGVHTVRSLDDAEQLRGHIWPGRRVLVVGGGVIGLEVAASAITMGAEVTVIERNSRLMARGAPQALADILLQLHRDNGVRFVFGAEITEAGKAGNGEINLLLASGETLSGDLVVYGIGVELNVELAVSAGLHVEDGIITNIHGQTSHPHIYAAGDVARQWNPDLQACVRHETWGNAQAQGAAVARAMVTGEPCPQEVPWYWTDQYGQNFQIAGRHTADEWLVRGDRATGKYTLLGLTDGIVTGAMTVNNGREMRPAKALIAARGRIPHGVEICNPGQDLRKLVALCA